MPGSAFHQTAEDYREILARNAIELQILESRGAMENLERLDDPKVRVDIGFVQSGLADEKEIEGLVSLGSLYYEPLWVFYRGSQVLDRLSQLRGKRVAVGAEGSGTRVFALRLLKANGVDDSSRLRDEGGEQAVQALRQGEVDAAFLIGNSSTPIVRELLEAPGISLMSLVQADGYVRRFPYLYKLVLPRGTLDLGKDLPAHDVVLVGPTAELIAREDLHPALSDLLIEAAQEVHGGAGLFRRAGEFPAAREHDFAISDDAERYYKSGQRFFYRHLPFWLASLVDRTLVLVIPVVVRLIPGVGMVPALYRWRVRLRIYRWYGALMALERDMRAQGTPEERGKLLERLDAIEQTVNQARVPLFFADQVYGLRAHIEFVRERLKISGSLLPA